MTEHPPTISVFLTFKGFSQDFQEISKAIGIIPTTACNQGDPTQAGRISSASFWSIELFSGDAWSVGDVLEMVLDEATLDGLHSGRPVIDGEAWLGVSISFTKPPSMYIRSGLMGRLANLRIDLDIDLFDRATDSDPLTDFRTAR